MQFDTDIPYHSRNSSMNPPSKQRVREELENAAIVILSVLVIVGTCLSMG
jgi:hypothetical protein